MFRLNKASQAAIWSSHLNQSLGHDADHLEEEQRDNPRIQEKLCWKMKRVHDNKA